MIFLYSDPSVPVTPPTSPEAQLSHLSERSQLVLKKLADIELLAATVVAHYT